MFTTFHDIMMSKPETFQDTAMVKLGSSAQVLGMAGGAFGSGANLTNLLSGRARTAQGSQATQLIGQGVQLTSGVTQTANMINSSAQTMKAAKARLTSLVTMARSQGFHVEMATGVVTPGPNMVGPGVNAAYYAARAAMFNQQIQTVVFQVNAQDIAVKLGLAKTALDVVNFVIGAAGGSGSGTTDPNLAPVPTAGPLPTAGALPTGATPTGAMPTGGTPTGAMPTGGLPNVGTGVGAVPATVPLPGGATPHYGLAGVGSLGVEPMGGATTHGIAALGNGTAAAGVSGLSGANQAPTTPGPAMVGQSGAGGGSVLGMGGAPMGASGRGGERRESTAWRQLTEDEDVWGGDDIPDTNDGVLA